MIIDNYIDIRTLRLLGKARKGVAVTVFSDNVRNYLHRADFDDFRREYPGVEVKVFRSGGLMHDRFIVLDYGEKGERVYHSGASSKDAGRGTTLVSEVIGESAKKSVDELIERLKKNGELKLK